jgi:hypothetical protein
MGNKIFNHYRAYPQTWNGRAFRTWSDRADTLFDKIVSDDGNA